MWVGVLEKISNEFLQALWNLLLKKQLSWGFLNHLLVFRNVAVFSEIFAKHVEAWNLGLRFQLLSQELGTFEAICVPCVASKLREFLGDLNSFQFFLFCFKRKLQYLCFTSVKEEKSWWHKLIIVCPENWRGEVLCTSFFQSLGFFFRVGNVPHLGVEEG